MKHYFEDKALMQVIFALTKSSRSPDEISKVTGLPIDVIIMKLEMLKQKGLINTDDC